MKPSSTVLPFFVPERRTRYRRAQKPSQSSAWKFAVERAPDVAGPRSVENQPSGLLLQPGPRCSFQTIWKSLPYSLLSGERPDRSRPPQAGAAAHACTASAVRTAPGQNFPPTRTLPSRAPRTPLPAIRPAPVLLLKRRSREAETGGPGGNYFPRRGSGQRPESPARPLPIPLSYPSPGRRPESPACSRPFPPFPGQRPECSCLLPFLSGLSLTELKFKRQGATP